jgi:hypothetical protein
VAFFLAEAFFFGVAFFLAVAFLLVVAFFFTAFRVSFFLAFALLFLVFFFGDIGASLGQGRIAPGSFRVSGRVGGASQVDGVTHDRDRLGLGS